MEVLILDDHALFSAGLRMLLRAIEPSTECFEASDIASARLVLQRQPRIGLCLLDLALKVDSGLDAIRVLKSLAPQLMIVVVSGTEDSATIRACIDAGAMSFIPKSAAPETLTLGLRHVMAGEIYLPEHLSAAPAGPPGGVTLTPRQRDVLEALSRGLPTKLIARELGLSEYTVKEHLATLFEALGARNRTDAVIRASRLGLGLRRPA